MKISNYEGHSITYSESRKVTTGKIEVIVEELRIPFDTRNSESLKMISTLSKMFSKGETILYMLNIDQLKETLEKIFDDHGISINWRDYFKDMVKFLYIMGFTIEFINSQNRKIIKATPESSKNSKNKKIFRIRSHDKRDDYDTRYAIDKAGVSH